MQRKTSRFFPKMPDAPATTTPRTSRAPSPQQPSEDDICPLCHVLLINPVITSCNHTFCQSCISHWAAVAPVSTTLTPVPLDTPLPSADSNEASIPLEMLCPMCRTVSGITPDSARAATLRARYTTEYAQRLAEDGETTWGNDLGLGAGTGKIEYLTLHIGNLHDYARDVGLEDFSARKSENQHRWTFFVRPSRCDVVRSVLIVLVCPPLPSHNQVFSPLRSFTANIISIKRSALQVSPAWHLPTKSHD